jgi:predicted HicB family RNase H-like nuclease
LETNDEAQKKSESFLIRVEKDIHDFYVAEAKRRRVPVAQVLRELLYREFEEKRKGTNGKL